MPAKKKEKNRTRADLSSSAEGMSVPAAASEMGFEPRVGPAPFPGEPWFGRKRTMELNPGALEKADVRDDMESLPGRLQNRITWESASPFSDNLWLAEMLQQTGLRLTHRYNSAEIPGCDTPQVMAALFVVQAWLLLVPGK